MMVYNMDVLVVFIFLNCFIAQLVKLNCRYFIFFSFVKSVNVEIKMSI